MNNSEKVERFTNLYINDINKKVPFYDQFAFKLGNCYLRKKEFETALIYYQMSINSCFKAPQYWKASGQVNWLVDILILSKQLNLLDSVIKELDLYKLEPKLGNSPIAYYSYSVACLLKKDNNPEYWIQSLLEKPTPKVTYIYGESFRAIICRNEIEFNQDLTELINIHDGQVKHGELRETGEGLICMSGMSLVYLAMQNGLNVTIESEYINPDYFIEN
jgi:tetratricopeptide (TPR) repeat protein